MTELARPDREAYAKYVESHGEPIKLGFKELGGFTIAVDVESGRPIAKVTSVTVHSPHDGPTRITIEAFCHRTGER